MKDFEEILKDFEELEFGKEMETKDDLDASGLSKLIKITPDEQLLRLIFSSRLATDSKNDGEIALQYIMHKSRDNNPRYGISSMIYCNLDTFNIVMVLEGPVEFVQNLFSVVAQDSRHTRVCRLLEQRILQHERWYKENGCFRGSNEDFAALKRKLGSIRDVKAIDLQEIDRMPIAGDLDLRLYRLTYHSDFKESNKMRAMQLMQDILERSQKKNERLLIGGVLYLNTNTRDVFQCLEGPCNAVKGLYSQIEQDSRHENVEIVLLEEPKENQRRYRTWGMVWASKEDSKVLFESLPPSVISKILRK